MTYTKQLTHYVVNFVDALVAKGLTDVVISPGSRSTPLAVTICEHKSLQEWVIIDERSAAFFALGMAQRTNRPVALVCTSGTAAVNYYPAIVEAYHNRIPLLVLTTDRPHELRDIGAPQAIDQIKMYGNYVKWFKEMLLPESSERALADVRRTAMLAMTEATSNNPGPVHLNFPFREPLMPDFSIDGLGEILQAQARDTKQLPFIMGGEKRLNDEQLQAIVQLVNDKKRGVFVVGPQRDFLLAQPISELAARWNIPILADPLSQLRTGSHDKSHIITMYDAILRDETVRERLKPEFILRFGAMPVSKMFLFYLEQHKDVPQIIIEDYAGYRQPTEKIAHVVYANGRQLCHDLLKATENTFQQAPNSWLNLWQASEKIAQSHLFTETEHELTEGEAVRRLLEVIPNESYLYIGNSMAVRDLDTFLKPSNKSLTMLNNRGVNGIDGVTSSALGAAACGKRVTLIIGDLSFYHDLNGLLAAKHYDIDITILLINNDGGGIFSFLSQAKEPKYFEKLFGTPVGIDFAPAVNMYGRHFTSSKNIADLQQKLSDSYARKGLSVIEVVTDRTENVSWHREKWDNITNDLLQRE